VGEWAERIGHPRRLVHAQLRAMLGRELPCAGYVVGVDVGVDDVAESELALAKKRLVLGGVDGRVDDCRFMRLGRGDEIRRATAAFVEDLLEVHSPSVGTMKIPRLTARNDKVLYKGSVHPPPGHASHSPHDRCLVRGCKDPPDTVPERAMRHL